MAAEAASVRDLLTAAALRLGADDAGSEAALLLAQVLAKPRAWLAAWPEYAPDPTQRARFAALVEARARGEPVAYLLGWRGFWTFDLQVSPAVLIPRPETELLVELALERLPRAAASHIADLGTGSGAIAIALARERPRASVLATDASADALAVARANAARLAAHGVGFAQGHWCEALGTARFDMIVANPPYIAAGDAHLAQGDLRFEPVAALASGADGLDAIRTIITQAPRHLLADGWLLLEHGHDQGAAVRALLAAAGCREVATVRDLAGNERVSLARR
ncbi:MAG: peptide chain release factor N(5)-glutamine methyltransferase [Dokdonella sp.]|uniref:peptide chain release factor N(5)-glutamine methyltransferase n=1 Tax=Dokdonella sp. TaxID=2291710 RepID=UPI0025BB48E8|nr:peptide chain release factor N(5)-glutamine methyltransferase [Dokdonella sp.]MBX3701287.1 peptide chain release factor N(5)-glutamine methyltransferase [Dokdonella sp.]